MKYGSLLGFPGDHKCFIGTWNLNLSHCVGCRVVFCGNKMFFFFQVRMMDVEKWGTGDMNSKKQNGKNISRD